MTEYTKKTNFHNHHIHLNKQQIKHLLFDFKLLILQKDDSKVANFWHQHQQVLTELAKIGIVKSAAAISEGISAQRTHSLQMPLIRLCQAIDDLATSID
ncbi:hypothetical protein tloyanaT_17320 [Thalassotalea loyana]|uniref:Uncharacterized protein n=1 Tax=Thalassotalea loyana TaxID=280483 RepID=A0ABQ6HFF3_9GAMM|nr:hypothetical protein [Thalassotalea loyana]GLX85480.1 hypothetical protein tloyanaT_17320 [Thalassotalea loyana]